LYYDKKFAIVDFDYYTDTILYLEETARKKLSKWLQDSREKWEVRNKQEE